MLRFFRQIRKNLMEQPSNGRSGNKTRSYLLYAFGEIALVMIGILLALQVNNWNEERKANTTEQLLLINLREDFEIRLNELEEFQIARASGIATIHELAGFVNITSSLPSKEKMDSLFVDLNNAYSFNDQFKMLDVLFSTGQINQLKNQELKKLLLQWPQYVEEMMEEQRERGSLYENVLQPLQHKYISLREVFELFDFRGYNLPRGVPITKESDYMGLITDPVFENYLSETEFLLFLNEIDSKVLIENAQQIIVLLNESIGDR